MAERATVFQVSQWGVETTPGTAVAANKKLQAIGVEPGIQAEFNTFRPIGQKFPTLVIPGKEWVEADLNGMLTYTDIVYPLSSVLDVATITTPGGATNARLWTFVPDAVAADAPKTFTIESGSGVRAQKFAHGLVTSLGLEFTRDSIEVSGTILGQLVSDGITLTSSPTAIALVPVLPKQVSVYLDDTSGGLGGTQLTRALRASVQINNRYNPLWTLDATKTSFATYVEAPVEATITLVLEADSSGMALLTAMRAGSTKFLRIEAVGEDDSIETDAAYTFILDAAVKVGDAATYSDEDGVYAISWPLTVVYDSGWGKALQVQVENALTAL